jgi:LmbE family N-acetylglucosaminyl deacetylase
MILEQPPPPVWTGNDCFQWIERLNDGAKWAVLAPHPDDELIMAYGFMRQWPSTGKLIIITDGSKGVENGFESLAEHELVALRYKETLDCAARFGIRPSQIVFLGAEDGGRADIRRSYDEHDPWEPLVRGTLDAFDPHIILAPHPDELHPDHIRTGKLLKRMNWNGQKLFTCYPRGLSLGEPAYSLKLTPQEWARKCEIAAVFASQKFVSEKLTDPFFCTERLWTPEQISSVPAEVPDDDPKCHFKTDVLSHPAFQYLTDSQAAKTKRVEAAISAKIAASGIDPWGFDRSRSEKMRISRTVDMVVAARPRHVVDCGCCKGDTLVELLSRWEGSCLGIEPEINLANAAQNAVGESAHIWRTDIEAGLLALPELDTLILTEICYYIHPPHWHQLTDTIFSKARAIIFSMRPSLSAITFLSPLMRHMNICDVAVITKPHEALEEGWLIVRLELRGVP